MELPSEHSSFTYKLHFITTMVSSFTGWKKLTVSLDEGYILTIYGSELDAPYPVLLLKYNLIDNLEVIGKLLYVGLEDHKSIVRSLVDV